MAATHHRALGGRSKWNAPATSRVCAGASALLVSLGGELGCAPVSTEAVRSEGDPTLSDPMLPRGNPVGPMEPLPVPRLEPDASDDTGELDAGQPGTDPVDAAEPGPAPIPRPEATGFCAALPRLGQPPTLDGNIEPGLTLEEVIPQGWAEGPPAGNAMRFSAAWLPSGLYFFLEVTDTELNPAPADAPIWQGDSVEAYVDHDGILPAYGYDPVGAKQLMLGAPIEGQTDPVRGDVYMSGNRERSWNAAQYVGVPTAGGYAIELLVSAPDLDLASWSLEAGDYVGFDLAHSVSHPLGVTGANGNRLGQYFLRVASASDGSTTDYPWLTAHVFCVPRLD
jgi:hypothetical protein